MKTNGILMKAEMIRAYLAGNKSMTRRTRGLDEINQNPDDWKFIRFEETIKRSIGIITKWAYFQCLTGPGRESIRLPYGWIGDTLWFKETYATICRNADPYCSCETEEYEANHYIEYRADTGNAYPGDWPEDEARGNDEAPKWKSSMFMPRKFSRISVPVVNVRVERVQDITEADAKAEGITLQFPTRDVPDRVGGDVWNYRNAFARLWDDINLKRGMGWDINPWTWVYEFPKYSKLEEETGAQ